MIHVEIEHLIFAFQSSVKLTYEHVRGVLRLEIPIF